MNQCFAYYEVSKEVREYDYPHLKGREVRVWWPATDEPVQPVITEGVVQDIFHLTVDPETGDAITFWGFVIAVKGKVDYAKNLPLAYWSPDMGGSIEYA